KKTARIDKIWLFGGPTASWGGSMEKDSLIKGCRYFGIPNALYVYGPANHEMLDTLKDLKRVVCHAGGACRNPGASAGLVEDAVQINRLSFEYPNIRGAISDDFLDELNMYQDKKRCKKKPEDLQTMYASLKQGRPDLSYYAVIYAHELYLDLDIAGYLPLIDVPVFWLWKQSEIRDIGRHVAKCAAVFKNKPILQGIFMFDYGEKNEATPLDLLEFQLDASLHHLKEDRIQGIVILGDREIKKCPAQAELIREWLKGIG
ncbi:MAG: hypothetical protein KKF10_06000, partial [Verrucomicrobia bacterium]|nr:hypothetical protein [Verrucomicrobiota bacterium]